MREFKINDIVKVKSLAQLEKEFPKDGEGFDCGDIYFVHEMSFLCGKTINITEDNFDGINIEIEDKYGQVWNLTPNMVHFLNDCKVDFPVEFPASWLAKGLPKSYFKPQLKIKKLREDAVIPTYATEGDSGLDLYTLDDCIIKAGQTVVIPTGIAIGLPLNHEAHVRPRSGISLNGLKGCKTVITSTHIDNHGRLCCNAKIGSDLQAYLRVQFGTVDNGYISDVGIITYNQEEFDIFIPAKTKLAQLVISPVTYVRTEIVEELDETERGSNGFGSSGV